jgi:predicted acyltransferase
MTQRFYALDVFRGMTVALMILVNTPGSWKWIYSPLRHAEWHGLTPTDLVFPFFLFAVGNAMAFVMPKMYKNGDAFFWQKVIKRTLIIFIIGLLLNWFPFVSWAKNEAGIQVLKAKPWSFDHGGNNFGGVRILGVLQRIAICYFFASIMVYYFKRNGAIAGAAALLLIYWVVCYMGNPADPYSLTGWVGNHLDQNIIGKSHLLFTESLYYGTPNTESNQWAKTGFEIGTIADSLQNQYAQLPKLRDSLLQLNGLTVKPSDKNTAILFDPEGLLSTISAIAQVVVGYIIGKFIIDNGNKRSTVEKLLIIGIVLGIIGTAWHQFFPVNKKIWSSSYTVLTCGMATVILAMLIYLFELLKVSQIWGKFFDAFGKNPLFIFVLSGALPRLLGLFKFKINDISYTPLQWLQTEIFLPINSDKQVGSFLFALFMIIFYWLIAYIMDKKKIYIKV